MPRTWRLRGFGAILLALALAASACGGTAAAPSATATAKPQPFALKVSYSNVIADELPLWATKEGGFFDQQGLDVGDLQLIASSQGVAALLSGKIDIAQIGGSETLSANAEAGGDGPLVVFAQLAGVYPFVLEVAPDIKSASDLKGKKVGVSAIGSSSDIATRVALKGLGLSDTDVTILAVGSAQQRIAAVQSGAIQAGVAQPPDSLQLESKGFHVLYDLATQKLPSANTSVVTTRTFMAAHRDVLQRYVDALILGTQKLKADKAFGISVLKKYLKLSDETALGATYDFYAVKVATVQPFVRPDMFKDAQTQLGAKNEKVKAYDVTKMLDTSLVQNAIDRGLGK